MQPTKVRDAHKKFIEFLKGKKHSSATILAYGKDVSQLTEFCQKQKITEIASVTTGHLEEFKAYLSQQSYTPKSVSRKLNSLKTFFRYLKAQGCITDDPATTVAHPTFETKTPRILAPPKVLAGARLDRGTAG